MACGRFWWKKFLVLPLAFAFLALYPPQIALYGDNIQVCLLILILPAHNNRHRTVAPCQDLHPLLIIHLIKRHKSNSYVRDWSQVSPKLIKAATQQATIGNNNTCMTHATDIVYSFYLCNLCKPLFMINPKLRCGFHPLRNPR